MSLNAIVVVERYHGAVIQSVIEGWNGTFHRPLSLPPLPPTPTRTSDTRFRSHLCCAEKDYYFIPFFTLPLLSTLSPPNSVHSYNFTRNKARRA